jgi:hypothetical protein
MLGFSIICCFVLSTDYLAGILASMREGSVMVTLEDLKIGLTQSEANAKRKEKGLKTSCNASFFECTKVEIGKGHEVVTWGGPSLGNIVHAYVYTRVEQDSEGRGAVTLCCNRECEHAQKGTPIAAARLNCDGKVVVGGCSCNISPRSRRPQVEGMKFEDFLEAGLNFGGDGDVSEK